MSTFFLIFCFSASSISATFIIESTLTFEPKILILSLSMGVFATRTLAFFFILGHPVEIDFSKMKPKPVSAPIVFHPTLEYKLAETEKKLAETEKKLAETEKKLADEIEANKAWESVYRTEIEEWKECYNEAMRTIDTLRQRIRDPFKSAISRPNF